MPYTNNGLTKIDTFSEMINEYLAYSDILMEAFKDQNWLLTNCNIKSNWNGGDLIVPFQISGPSSVSMGQLTAEGDIDSASYARGKILGYQELYASLIFNQKDLFEHGKISEQNFLKLLPDNIEQTMKWAKQSTSIQVLNGGGIDTVSTDPTSAVGILPVNHPERFMIGMKVTMADTQVVSIDGYVREIDKNNATLTIYTLRSGGALVDLSTLDATTVVYSDNQDVSAFTSLREMLLPTTADAVYGVAGGSDTFCTIAKSAQPFTQPVLYDASFGGADWAGAAVDGNLVLTLIFDAYRKGIQRGAEPVEWVMSWKHYSACLLALEKNSGGFKNVDDAVHFAGYSSIRVGGAEGSVKLTGVRELNDDVIYGLNPKYLDFHTAPQPWKVVTSPDGLKYYTLRTQTTGYSYILDLQFLGDFIYRCPWTACCIVNIPDYDVSAIT